MKRFCSPFIAAAAVSLTAAITSCNLFTDNEIYEPVVTFEGLIYEVRGVKALTALPGNIKSKNKCYLNEDTLEIYCYSKDYAQGTKGLPTEGDQLRISVFPFDTDSVTELDMRNMRIKFIRYSVEGSTQSPRSYLIAPKDTVLGGEWIIRAEARTLRRRVGAAVDLRLDFVPMHFVGKANKELEIENAEITGTIQSGP